MTATAPPLVAPRRGDRRHAVAQMVTADVLKLRKKRSVAGWALALTAGVTALGTARRAVLDAALAQLKPGPHAGRAVALPTFTAALITALWAVIALAAGAYRTATRDL